jgi:DhnA family fructose-bisphosphate aldolase class Ia
MNTLNHRLRRLKAGKSHYALLALDHGLTEGHTSESPPLPFDSFLTECSGSFGGFVANYGTASKLTQWPVNMSLVLQCFGAPKGYSRSLISTIDAALSLDAVAVSVQVDWNDKGLSERISEIGGFICNAHSVGLHVLLMVNGDGSTSNLPRSIRVCQEMGADLIKVNCEIDTFKTSDEDVISAIRNGPPVLMAGGARTTGFLEKAKNAAELGLSGYCVGRNFYQSTDPRALAADLASLFT